jgi:hypothetical protein
MVTKTVTALPQLKGSDSQRFLRAPPSINIHILERRGHLPHAEQRDKLIPACTPVSFPHIVVSTEYHISKNKEAYTKYLIEIFFPTAI